MSKDHRNQDGGSQETKLGPRNGASAAIAEFDYDVEVRVWDSTSEVRYLVVPERPAGTQHMKEGELAALVTRNEMLAHKNEWDRAAWSTPHGKPIVLPGR